ncbi:bifunctional diaminohydroxyphosphoribosylaminopyrimidine deaminase/5-amino-6-(5-phosphoribosylamino)uracil reductase RibD [Rheinheimera sp.]|uniref:bifunctional diaminohydroxyphosphoribosylaminopyrimidine deaminase/5-amino-6-(5-phosphoribosylamino)uracil reductase RibD n=1 Tax=Rheinheimera sp. TaxID=1869214 RepID=UPI00307FBFA6
MRWSDADQQFMQQALQLAQQGRFTTAPNPNVGAVVVLDGKVVGQGYHHQAGQPHAEVYALREAGSKALGATCYVTLEPCSHYGRTGPCALALVDAGVSRVVVAMLDPNPLVAGKGVAILQQAGIEVHVGLYQREARALNPGFLSRMERQRPWLRLKLACSLDGAIALANGESQWLTGPEARADVQLERAASHAILSTATTVMQDQARLTVRAETAEITPLLDGTVRQPVRIILDRQLKLTGQELLFQSGGPIWLVHSDQLHAPESNAPVRYLAVPEHDGQLDLQFLLRLLAEQQINDLWVEAGATLASSLWQQQLVDELIVYQAPLLLGAGSQPLLHLASLNRLADAPRWQWQQAQCLGPDVKLRACLQEP